MGSGITANIFGNNEVLTVAPDGTIYRRKVRYSPPPASLPPSYVSFHNVVLLLDLFDRMFLNRAEGPEYGGVHFAELFLPRMSLNV
jgi:hypothetical protein